VTHVILPRHEMRYTSHLFLRKASDKIQDIKPQEKGLEEDQEEEMGEDLDLETAIVCSLLYLC